MHSLKQKAYGIIKERIISCTYVPGQFLNEALLMEEIGASRTPIREALSKLEQEGFVRIVSKKGIEICKLTMSEISDLYQVRLMLEPQIVLQWGQSIPVGDLEKCRMRLLSYNPGMQAAERNELDDSLHRLIFNSCSNSYLSTWMDHLYAQNERVRFFTGQIGRYMEKNNEEHLQILDLLLIGNYADAASLLTEHLEMARKNTISTLLTMEQGKGAAEESRMTFFHESMQGET